MLFIPIYKNQEVEKLLLHLFPFDLINFQVS